MSTIKFYTQYKESFVLYAIQRDVDSMDVAVAQLQHSLNTKVSFTLRGKTSCTIIPYDVLARSIFIIDEGDNG